MKLEIVWQEHELGNYPTIGLVWGDPMRGTPWNYISRCEAALTAFENGGELPTGWTMPPVRSEDELNEPFDPDKPPPEPPTDILDTFESERYISKLIQWGLEASKREPGSVRCRVSLHAARHETMGREFRDAAQRARRSDHIGNDVRRHPVLQQTPCHCR